MDGHPASPLRDLYHSAMGANPQFSTANGMQQVPYGRNQSVPGFSPSNTQFHQSNVAFLNPDSSTSSHPTPQNDTSTPAKITSNGVFQTVDAHPQVYQQGITSPNFSSQLPLANQPLGAVPGPSQPIRNPSAGIFMQQPNPQASHSPSVDGSAQVLQLPRVSGMDPAAIMEIAMLIRQPNGPNRLSHAQMAMWNEYRAKCGASPSGIQPRPANHSASLLGSVQPQSHPAQPQTVPHSLPNLNYSSQNQQQAIQRQQKLSPQQHAQLQQMQQQMLIRQQQQRQQQQVQQLLQQQQHHQHQQQAHHNQQLQSFSQQQKQLQPKSQVHQQQSSQQQQQQKQKQLQEQQQNHLQQHKEEEEEMGGGEADTESKELVQRQQEQQQQPQSQQQQHQLQKQYSHEQQQNNHTQSLQLQSSSAAARFSPSLSSRAPSVSYSMPRSTTPSFTSQLPSLTNNNRKPLIGLESPSQKTIQSPSKPSQIFPHPYSSQQQVNGNQHHPIPLTRTQSPSTSTPLYPRRLPISPSFTKHYPDNSVLGPDGRPRSRKKLSLEEQRKLSRWIKHDEAFEIAFQRDRMQKRAIMQDVCRQQVMINRLDWLGEARNGRATGRCQIRLPLEREREGSTGKRKNRPRLKLNKSEIKLVSEVEEILVPIRLEIEIDHWKLRDTFTWNLKEPVVTPEQFAAHLCEDLILPAQHFIGPIVNSIREQLDEYRIHQNFEGHYARHSSSEARNPDSKYEADVRRAGGSDVIKMIIEDEGNGEATQGAEEKWWNGWKGRVFDLGCDSEAGTETDEAAQIQEIKPGTFTDSEKTQSHYKSLLLNGLDFKVQYRSVEDFQGYNPLKENDDELRIPIVLDIICGHVHLTDRFEWEISEVNNSPEDFVEVYVNDLGLAGEFKTAIAHSIREQIETYVKSLALVEHVNGYPVPNDELRYAFLQPITEPIRTSQVDDYTPFLNFLNAEELDRQEKEHDREARRKRRQTRSRRGITLPDRESQRTVRSIVPIQGMKMVMPYQDDNEDLIVPVQPVAEPYPIEESVFENVDPPEHIPKKNVPVNKEPPGSEPLFGTPSKVVGNRVSRRLRGATADGQSGTPPPTSRGGDSNQPEKDDAPTPSNSGTPAPNTTTKKNNKQQEVASQTNSAKKFSAGRPRGINWKALGLHDPMINGVWHCSNCGCPEHIAVGRRKGLGGKDTLCGECGRYMHRYKKNRPTVYNTSADYHTSLKLEADSAKQAIADQEMLRQEKNRLEHLATRGSENKKPKKEGKGNLMPKSERLKRSIERSLSTASSVKSSGSRESSPIASTRPEKKLGTGKKLNSNKRLRTDDAGESNLNTRSAKSKKLALHSPGSIDSPETTSPSNGATPTLSLPPSETNAKQGRGGAKAREKRLVGASEKKKSISPSNETTTSSTAASESKRDEVANQDLPEEVPQKGRPSRKNSVLNDDEKSKVALQNTTNTSTKSNASPVVGEDLSRQTGSSKANSIQGESTKEKSARVGGNGRPISGARGRRFEPPSWMLTALSDIRSSFPSDKVELIPRLKREVVTPGQPPVVIGCDWRLKCFDCPGKLYTVGPGESFSNFDVHLKNRQHRQKVDERLNASQSSLAAQPVSQQQPLSQSQTQAQQSPSTNSQSSPQAQSRPQIEPLSQQSLSQQSPHLTPQSQPQQPRAQPAINHRSSIPGLPSIPLSPQVSPRVSQSLAVPPAVIAPGPVHPLPTLPNSSMNQVSQSTGNGHPTPNTILPAPPSTLVHPLPKKPML